MFVIGACAGIIQVSASQNIRNHAYRCQITAMLRDKSIFIDGGVQLSRNNESTWLGFSLFIFDAVYSRLS
jgi:hypothetical protein